jgi:hypothetical protein
LEATVAVSLRSAHTRPPTVPQSPPLLPYQPDPHTTGTRIWPLTEPIERARGGRGREGGREREKERENISYWIHCQPS